MIAEHAPEIGESPTHLATGLHALLSRLQEEMLRARKARGAYARPNVTLVLGNDREIGRGDLALEKRVGVTPDQVKLLREFLGKIGIDLTAIVVRGAGERAGFSDHEYITHGAEVVDWWELEFVDPSPDVVHALKEPSSKEALIRPPFLRIGALHTGDFSADANYLQLIERGVAIFDGSAIGWDHRIPIRGSMSKFAGRNGAERIIRHLDEHDLVGDVVIVGAGPVGRSAAERLLLSARLRRVHLFENAARKDHIAELEEAYAAEDRIDVRSCSGLDDPALLAALQDAVGLIIGVARKGAPSPKVVSVHNLAGMQPESLVIDISIDELGGITDPSIRHGWTHGRVISHLKEVVAESGRHYWAVANMPRVYPNEASRAHGEAVLPYLLTLLFLSALEGGPMPALGRIQRVRPGKSLDPLDQGTSQKLATLVKDLRNGLAFGRRGDFVLVERIVASRSRIVSHLVERRTPFETQLEPGDDVDFEGLWQVKTCMEDMFKLNVSGRLIHHPELPADSPATAARAAGVDARKALKCLLLEGADGEISAGILPGDRRLSADWMGQRSLLDPRRAFSQIGLPVKNVPLFSVVCRVPTSVDHAVLSMGKVIASAGHEHLSIEFDAVGLAGTPRVTRASMVSPEGVAKANEESIRRRQRELMQAIADNDDAMARQAVEALAKTFRIDPPEAGPAEGS